MNRIKHSDIPRISPFTTLCIYYPQIQPPEISKPRNRSHGVYNVSTLLCGIYHDLLSDGGELIVGFCSETLLVSPP